MGYSCSEDSVMDWGTGDFGSLSYDLIPSLASSNSLKPGETGF